jgi:hypothetical protein
MISLEVPFIMLKVLPPQKSITRLSEGSGDGSDSIIT